MSRFKVTQATFNAVHLARENGMKIKEIAEAFNCSEATVNNVMRYDTFEEFEEWKKDQARKERMKEFEPFGTFQIVKPNAGYAIHIFDCSKKEADALVTIAESFDKKFELEAC